MMDSRTLSRWDFSLLYKDESSASLLQIKVHDSPYVWTVKLFLKNAWSLFFSIDVSYLNGTTAYNFYLKLKPPHPEAWLILAEWLVGFFDSREIVP